MVRGPESSSGLCPDRFNSIETPPILMNPEHAMPNDGLPAFAQLDVLIAYSTAPTTVSDDVMSDFLMTFRNFASPRDVWRLSASRLSWSADVAARTGSESEHGKDVGTRCFVLMRQWVRDGFDTDFLPDTKSRQNVAETVTALAGCTEFVSLSHFHRILKQFRAVWDTKIGQYWVLPPGIAHNIDAPVPMGGDPPELTANTSSSINTSASFSAQSHARPSISHLLAGEIPIDADIAVTNIHCSPPRQKLKPRPKLSTFFNRASHKSASFANLRSSHSQSTLKNSSGSNEHEGDVLSHDRVDSLAMQLIDEYHNRERSFWIPRSDDCSIDEPDMTISGSRLRNDDAQSSRKSTSTQRATSDLDSNRSRGSKSSQRRLSETSAGEIFAQIGYGNNSSNEESSRQMSSDLILQMSSSKVDLTSKTAPQSPRRFSSTTDESGHSDDGNVDYTTHAITSTKSSTKSSTQPRAGNSSNNDNPTNDHNSIDHAEHARSESIVSGDDIEIIDDAASVQDLRDHDCTDTEADRPKSRSRETSNYNLRDAVTPEPPTAETTGSDSESDDGLWATPRRSPDTQSSSQWNLSQQQKSMSQMAHDKSMDTLNMNNMGLANISGESDMCLESAGDSQFESGTNRAEIRSFDVLDFNDFETYNQSYCGSSLSTVSTSTTNSKFSYHDSSKHHDVNRSFNMLRAARARNNSRSESDNNVVDMDTPVSTRSISPQEQSDQQLEPHRHSETSSISLISEFDNSKMVPCAGYTDSDAAILKSMPDDEITGDASLATSQKLEGGPSTSQVLSKNNHNNIDAHTFSYAKKTADANGDRSKQNFNTIPRSSTIELYNQASESSDHAKTPERKVLDRKAREELLDNEISQLGIALNEAPRPCNGLVLGKEYQAYDTDHMQNGGANAADETTESMNIRADEMAAQYSVLAMGGAQPRSQYHQPEGDLRGLASPFQSRNCTAVTSTEQQPDVPKPSPTLYIGLPGASHAPFILAYSARAIAEQMTLIERETVRQLDWNALLRMEWPRQTEPTKSWLQVMMDDPIPQGTALVQARFDLVYKWVQSEISLCPHPGLQAQAISRFIQIAFEALRSQNFATMVQSVSALCSAEVQTQLNELVFQSLPPHDKETLERLEFLSSPQQNYAKLRRAHNRYSWSKGCIPLTSMFLQDIELTAQANSFNAEHEIHFGKYRVCAHLVKSLRRCVESTTNYDFALDPALFSKCLYLASLPESST